MTTLIRHRHPKIMMGKRAVGVVVTKAVGTPTMTPILTMTILETRLIILTIQIQILAQTILRQMIVATITQLISKQALKGT